MQDTTIDAQNLALGIDTLRDCTVLANLFEKLPDLAFPLGQNRVELQNLTSTVISQQLSTKVAKTLYQRLTNLVNDKFTCDSLLSLSPEQYKEIGISNAKSRTIRGIAQAVDASVLPLAKLQDLSNEEISNLMLPIWGVGPWTVQCTLLFQLNRIDIWPKTDLGVINALRDLTANKALTAAQAEIISEEFKPYRSIAARLLWKWINFIK